MHFQCSLVFEFCSTTRANNKPIVNVVDMKMVSESLDIRDSVMTSRAMAGDFVVWPNTQRAGEIHGFLKSMP
jgi:hypothetical protein